MEAPMPRKPSLKPPAYSLHKASGRAVTRINGRDIYLGKHGSPESHEAYERAIAEWRANAVDPTADVDNFVRPHHRLTVNEVLLAYARFARSYYRKALQTGFEITTTGHSRPPKLPLCCLLRCQALADSPTSGGRCAICLSCIHRSFDEVAPTAPSPLAAGRVAVSRALRPRDC